MTVNLMDALNQNIGDVERPPLPPQGNYIFKIEKVPDIREVGQGAYETVDFTCRGVEARDDVDADELAEFGPVINIQIRLSFMFNKEDENKFQSSLFRLRTFLENHVQCASESDSLKEALANSLNNVFMGEVQYRPDKNDKEVMYAEIRATAPVE